MKRQEAAALVVYLQRAHAIVPTTGAEWNAIQGALTTIEGVANGFIEVDARPPKAVETALAKDD